MQDMTDHTVGTEWLGRMVHLIILTTLFLPSGCADPEEEKGATVLRVSYSHSPQPESEIHFFAEAFKEMLLARTDDFDVKLYASNALGQEREVYEGIQLGAGATCAVTGTAILSNFDRRVGVLDLPYLWNDYPAMHRALDGEVGAQIRSILLESGFEVVTWLDSWGFRNVASATRPISNAQDLKGMKLRTIPSPSYIAAVQAMRAIPSPMAFGEIYTSLETGVIDGFEHTSSVILANRLYEVTDYLAITRHMLGPVVFVCSRDKLAQLPEEAKEHLYEAARQAARKQRSQSSERAESALVSLESKGMAITVIDTSGFASAARDAQEALARDIGAENLLAMIRDTGSPY